MENSMNKYAIMFDECEIKATVRTEDIIDAYCSGGMLNGSAVKEIAVYDDIETAQEALKQYKCVTYLQSAWVGKVRICELYFIQEREYNEGDEYEDTGCYDFAEIQDMGKSEKHKSTKEVERD